MELALLDLDSRLSAHEKDVVVRHNANLCLGNDREVRSCVVPIDTGEGTARPLQSDFYDLQCPGIECRPCGQTPAQLGDLRRSFRSVELQDRELDRRSAAQLQRQRVTGRIGGDEQR